MRGRSRVVIVIVIVRTVVVVVVGTLEERSEGLSCCSCTCTFLVRDLVLEARAVLLCWRRDSDSGCGGRIFTQPGLVPEQQGVSPYMLNTNNPLLVLVLAVRIAVYSSAVCYRWQQALAAVL